ncbi:4-alpha-glucanotransferase [Treponema sp.]|uniref:4-alpha-glucanotransferase n=1 Tax=Treponema sp. TaxID=166 RepID=UPI00388E3DB5
MVKRKTGIAVPLGALRSESSPVIGEFTSLMEFANFASKAHISIIQLLPVLDTGTQTSPYSSLSAFALNPVYINLTILEEFQKCYDKDSVFKRTYDLYLQHKKDERFDYGFISDTKDFLLRKMFSLLTNTIGTKDIKQMQLNILNFIDEHKSWLPYYCVYKYLKYKFVQAGWKEWKKPYQKMTQEQILEIWNTKSIEKDLYFYVWEQFIAYKQLKIAADYVKSLDIILKGDLPILLNEDSCDVWATPELFNLKMRAGSPPDGDNPAGQNWGFPCYDFTYQEKDNFSWWRKRLSTAAIFFDAYRLDHIPGFFRLWSIPENELTAEMGHTEPCATVTEAQLLKAGFSKERIRWLSQPHIPTEDFIRLIGNPVTTREILSLLCERIGYEELWLFKSSIKSEIDIKKINLDKYNIDVSIQMEIFRRLGAWWKNRTLLEISKNKYLPLWKYKESRSWASLSEDEKYNLEELFAEINKKQDKLWKNQAEKIFTAFKNESDMTFCGEDLGAYIPCMEKVLDKFGILGLKVIRWCRNWEKQEQPYCDIHTYRKLSVVTTSVHDSSTFRDWHDNEVKQILIDIPHKYSDCLIDESKKSNLNYYILEREYQKVSEKMDPATCENLLSAFAKTSGVWFINPLQDWLYLDSKYYSDDPKKERINIPGTVSQFNWTWRMPVNIEKLFENEKLIEKIKKIAEIHDGQ